MADPATLLTFVLFSSCFGRSSIRTLQISTPYLRRLIWNQNKNWLLVFCWWFRSKQVHMKTSSENYSPCLLIQFPLILYQRPCPNLIISWIRATLGKQNSRSSPGVQVWPVALVPQDNGIHPLVTPMSQRNPFPLGHCKVLHHTLKNCVPDPLVFSVAFLHRDQIHTNKGAWSKYHVVSS